jgi:hypothetical protein
MLSSATNGNGSASVPPRGPRSTSWLRGAREALSLLVPIAPPATASTAPLSARDADPIPWIVPLGVVTGILWAASFRFSWRLYGETANLRIIPALTLVLMETLLTGPFLALGLARTVHLLTGRTPLRCEHDREEPLSPLGTLALCLTVLSQWALIASVPTINPWYPMPQDWRSWFSFMYPAPIYRPLILAPLWGRWAILLAASIGCVGKYADEQIVSLSTSLRPGRLLRHSLIPLILTAIYCSRDQNFLTGAIIGLLVFAMTYVVTVLLSRRGGGQSRQSIYAAAQIAQLSFLLFYRAFWRQIHG